MRRCRSTIWLSIGNRKLDDPPLGGETLRCELMEGHATGRWTYEERQHMYHVYANVVVRWVGAGRKIESRIRWIG